MAWQVPLPKADNTTNDQTQLLVNLIMKKRELDDQRRQEDYAYAQQAIKGTVDPIMQGLQRQKIANYLAMSDTQRSDPEEKRKFYLSALSTGVDPSKLIAPKVDALTLEDKKQKGRVDIKTQEEQARLAQIDEAAKVKPKTSASIGLRDQQFWERQKIAAGKDMNISRASSRSPLGVAVTNNQKARRALKLLNKKGTFTTQDQSLITTDLTAMMKGGSPDEELLRQNQYGTYYSQGVSLLQKITNTPQNLNDPEIKQHLKETILGIVNVDDQQIKDHIDSTENQYADLIAKDPKWWDNTKKTASRNLFTESGFAESPASSIVDHSKMSDADLLKALGQ